MHGTNLTSSLLFTPVFCCKIRYFWSQKAPTDFYDNHPQSSVFKIEYGDDDGGEDFFLPDVSGEGT